VNRRGARPVLLAPLILVAACAVEDGDPNLPLHAEVFTDVTAESGLEFEFDRARGGGHFMPDSLAGGCAFLDYDADGDLDVYVVLGLYEDGNVHPDGANRLFRQDDDGRFTDVSEISGTADTGYGMGVAAGDIDNDGFIDLYVTNFGANVLYRNNGDGTFSDISTAAGVADPRWGASAGFLDFDADGWLDLFVTNYVQYVAGPGVRDSAGRPEYPGPDCCPGTADVLYRNDGDGTFTDISAETGIADARGKGLGVGLTDLDRDGRLDIYVANDGEANRAWVQEATGSWRDAAGALGVGLNGYGGAEASMGVVVADLNEDRRFDLFLTHLFQESNTLYLAQDAARFADATLGSGLGKQSNEFTGFGTAAVDVDLDGLPELVVVNGRVLRAQGDREGHWPPYAERNLLFWNDGGGQFRLAGSECGTLCSDIEVDRGLATGDVDNDGDADLLVATASGGVRLFHNVRPRDAHWIGVKLIDPEGPRDATGATVEVRTAETIRSGAVRPTSSYLSSNDPRVLFGLGPLERVDRIEVTWPDGTLEFFDAPGVDRYHVLVRGEGKRG
jgi:hypothetical protein